MALGGFNLFGKPGPISAKEIRAESVIVAVDGSGDTDSIEEAIKLLTKTGGIIFVKEGTYTTRLDTSLALNANTRIIGTGNASIIKPNSGSAQDILTMAANTSVENLQIDGLDTGSPGVAISSTDCSVINCFIKGCDDDAIVISSTSRAKIIGNFITGSVDGIDMTSGDECIISGNNISSNDGGAEGIRMASGCDDNLIANNIIKSNGQNGIRITATSDNNIITGNVIKSNSDRGIHIENSNCDKNILHGNIVLSNSTAQITDSGTATVVADNIVT